ncbi:MAG: histidine phosphatase family protein [Campylobacterota bacterium]|nr:histidine phosphatase family protein [Campylobacterota bacterium]
MKKLYIIRHAKSSWKDLSLDDFDRPLNKRGRLDAPVMGARLKEKNILPDVIISSSALRAKITAEVIAKSVGYDKDIQFEKDLYESSALLLYTTVMSVDDNSDTLFLFGHNTGINEFVEEYVKLYDNVPTCGVVEIEFECDKWIDITKENAKLISFDYPKNRDPIF